MKVEIRRACLDDLLTVFEIESACFFDYQKNSKRNIQLSLSSPFQEVWLLDLLNQGTTKTIGYVQYFVYKKTLRIFSLAIIPEYQNQGFGKQMLRHAINSALSKNQERISLEAAADNKDLITWYLKNGFVKSAFLPNYYAPDIHAHRFTMSLVAVHNLQHTVNLIVVDNPRKWNLNIDNVKVISAKEYTSDTYYYAATKKIRLFNLCSSYKYQSLGYYVSLLASARDQRVIPNVSTIRDFHDVKIIKSITYEIDELIQTSLSKCNSHVYTCNVYFGNTVAPHMRVLASKLYNIFETPLFMVSFVKNDTWSIKKIQPISLHKIKSEDFDLVQYFAVKYFSAKRFVKPRVKQYLYDLAILVNPQEKNPPSCSKALQCFKKTAEKMGFYTEFITKADYNRMSEFDALFIRETTSVNNYTYQISRKAYAEVLVVIDEPWSILRCSNKIFLYERLKIHGIFTPKSVVLYKHNSYMKAVEHMDFPIVLKQPDSAFSIGVEKVNSIQELSEALAKLFKGSDLIIAQEFLPSEYDWRIGVIDQKAIFACKYYMAKNHWQIYNWQAQSNEAIGDSITLPIEEVPQDIVQAATKAASLMGDGLYGVDLKKINSKVYVIEVNDNPNIDWGIEDAVLGLDLYKTIIDSFRNRIEMARNIARFIPSKQD